MSQKMTRTSWVQVQEVELPWRASSKCTGVYEEQIGLWREYRAKNSACSIRGAGNAYVAASLELGVNSSVKSQQLRMLNREWCDHTDIWKDQPGWHLSLLPGKATHSLQLFVISLHSHWGHFSILLHGCVNRHEGIKHCQISMFTQEILPSVLW